MVQGAVLLVLGLALYLVPALERVLWPWALTPLTARAVASWLIAFGLGAVLAGRADDLARLEICAWSYGLMAVLEIVVVARHVRPDPLDSARELGIPAAAPGDPCDQCRRGGPDQRSSTDDISAVSVRSVTRPCSRAADSSAPFGTGARASR